MAQGIGQALAAAVAPKQQALCEQQKAESFYHIETLHEFFFEVYSSGEVFKSKSQLPRKPLLERWALLSCQY
jgi:hypothetical protein